MSRLNQFKLLSEYNQLMNQRLYDTVETLPPEKINEDTGAFFKSLQGTLNHILVGDIIWLSRFSTNPASYDALSYIVKTKNPKSLNAILFSDFIELRTERETVDKLIIQWINGLTEKDLDADISYKNMNGDKFKKNYASLINHLFLHQVHHRGQATTILSQFGVDFGDTDLIEII